MRAHPDDALSALLDGELASDEAAELRAHLDACASCQRELEEIRDVRRLVRALPAVEPTRPLGLPRPASRYAVANVAASVAAGLLLLLVTSGRLGPASLKAEVAGAVERHASTISALQAGGMMSDSSERLEPAWSVPPTTAPRRAVDDLPAPFGAPRVLGEYELVEGYRTPRGVHLLYRRGGYGLSVIEESGRLDWDALPAEEGHTMTIGGRRAWRWDAAPSRGRLVVFEHGGMVVTVVGDEPGDAVIDAVAAMPGARDLSMRDRVSRAVARALELLGPMP